MSNTMGYMPPQPPPPGPPPSGQSTGSVVAQVLLGVVAGVLLVLAILVGLGEVGILSMATDPCGPETKCSTPATVAMLVFAGACPTLILVIVGILAIISAVRKFAGAGSVAAILWYGVIADIFCLIASYVAATNIAPS